MCEARPGAFCTYVNDLFKGRVLVHARGKRMPGVHNARAGVVKARWRAEYREQETGRRQRCDAEMAALYESGKTLEEVAGFAGLSTATVRRRLAGAGVVIRAAGPVPANPWTAERDESIAAAYAAGISPREIAGQEDVTRATVYNALHRRGVQLRRVRADA